MEPMGRVYPKLHGPSLQPQNCQTHKAHQSPLLGNPSVREGARPLSEALQLPAPQDEVLKHLCDLVRSSSNPTSQIPRSCRVQMFFLIVIIDLFYRWRSVRAGASQAAG